MSDRTLEIRQGRRCHCCSHSLLCCLFPASLASLPVVQFDFLHSSSHQVTPPISPPSSVCLSELKAGRGGGGCHLVRNLIWSLLLHFCCCCKSHLTVWGVSVGPGLGPSSFSPSSSSSLLLTPPSHPTQDHRGRLELRAGYILHTHPPPPSWHSSSFPAIALPFVVFLPSITTLSPLALPPRSLPSCFFLRPPPPLLLSPAAVTALSNQLMWTSLTFSQHALCAGFPPDCFYTCHSAPSLTFHFICINHKPFGDVKIIIYVLKDVLRLFSMFTELIQEQFASLSAIIEFKTVP